MKEIKGYIIDRLEHENRLCKKTMTKNKHALKKPYPVSFMVKICSLWGNEGEKDASAKASTLEEAMEQSIKEFKIINKRNDVQGNYFVIAYLRNGLTIDIPKKYWAHILNKEEKQ